VPIFVAPYVFARSTAVRGEWPETRNHSDCWRDIPITQVIHGVAHKIKRLAEMLVSASHRGVRVRLILEFGVHSQFQLTHDAHQAFPDDLRATAEVFYWPLEKRGLNLFGKPGKLHAKAAVVDKDALLSSANLTDDAFLRNLELGVQFVGGEMPIRLREHFEHLIASGTLLRWNP